ncbi:fumarylacetoacetate hydrolase family protein [Schauerella aestuarii]|uniref:fumarylacetoacetate hydrolase family protein n=1 Tax=Schauerella aestuarii TaxID=2511204 RepID=UPI00136CCAC5|nr:fumarylacetoacetate hydrolase family protein [Achromobacter aestuarii]MYZ43294.1 FAA hydrolase family protein [Achromobacter aestuarii]
MRFVSFHDEGGQVLPGFLTHAGSHVVNVFAAGGPPWAAGLPRTLQAWVDIGLADLAQRLGDTAFPEASQIPVSRVRLAAPLPRPGKIVGAAFNFHDALKERDMKPPETPVIFVKSGRTVIGPDDPVRLQPDVGNVTYEAELGVVIGRQALRVSRDDAMTHVAGYLIVNDVSASDMVRADKGFVRGKNQPTFCPVGPWLVTPDEIADPHDVKIALHLDDVLRQNGSTADLVFDIPALIAFISTQMPLDPGDIIATGTPAGVAVSHSPPAWLQPGSRMSVSLPGLGTLHNPIVEAHSL